MEYETVGELLDWTAARCAAGTPFLGVYYSWIPHAPYPANYPEGATIPPALPPKERYRRLLLVLDEQIERIHRDIAARSCGRPAVLIVTGDHGEAFEEHPNNRYHELFVYEENVRVPLFFVAPDLPPLVSDRVASHVDLAPTILDLLLGDRGLERAATGGSYEGRSLLRAAEPWPVFSVTLIGEEQIAARYGQFSLLQGPTWSRLFDTDHDPGEREDLKRRFPALAVALKQATARWAAYVARRAQPVTDTDGH